MAEAVFDLAAQAGGAPFLGAGSALGAAALASAHGAVYLLEPVFEADEIFEFKLLDFNEATEALLSVSANEARGRLLGEVMAEVAFSDLFVVYTRVRSTGRSADAVAQIVDDTGARRWLSQRVVLLGDALAVCSLDVTAAKAVEAQLDRVESAHAVGQLVGGVAHDFNNQLVSIRSSAEFIGEALVPGDPAEADVEEILKASDRAAILTGQLLSLTGLRMGEPREMDVNTIIELLVRTLRRLLGEDVSVTTRLAADLPLISARPGRLESVLLALAGNAREAMPRGGRLVIRTSVLVSDGRPWVMIALEDSGVGIRREALARIFDPGFSTKMNDGGGMGLYTAREILKRMRGNIEVHSELGRGATFCIRLPTCALTAVPTPTHRAAGQVRGLALVVDDDLLIRTVTSRMLERLGFETMQASGYDEAVDCCLSASRLDLLVCDVVLEHASGPEVAAVVLRRWPKAPVLFMSGYSSDILERHDVAEGAGFLCKPFSSVTLSEKVDGLTRGAAR